MLATPVRAGPVLQECVLCAPLKDLQKPSLPSQGWPTTLLASHRPNMVPLAISYLDWSFRLKCAHEYQRPADLWVRAPSTLGTRDGTPGVRLGSRRLYC